MGKRSLFNCSLRTACLPNPGYSVARDPIIARQGFAYLTVMQPLSAVLVRTQLEQPAL